MPVLKFPGEHFIGKMYVISGIFRQTGPVSQDGARRCYKLAAGLSFNSKKGGQKP